MLTKTGAWMENMTTSNKPSSSHAGAASSTGTTTCASVTSGVVLGVVMAAVLLLIAQSAAPHARRLHQIGATPPTPPPTPSPSSSPPSSSSPSSSSPSSSAAAPSSPSPTGDSALASVSASASSSASATIDSAESSTSSLPTSAARCEAVFQEYIPSEWEKEWKASIKDRQAPWFGKECEILERDDQLSNSLRYIRANQVCMRVSKSKETVDSVLTDDVVKLYSRMRHEWRCPGQPAQRVDVLIEPLVGFVRDPLTMCSIEIPDAFAELRDMPDDLEGHVQSKRMVLLGPAAPVLQADSTTVLSPTQARPDSVVSAFPLPLGSRFILMDIGASLYNAWGKATQALGAKWFVERFRKFGVEPDHLVSIEATGHSGGDIINAVPDALVGKYVYINARADKDPNGKFNPWRILKQIAQVSDYVVVKLDIDTPAVELPLITQVIENRDISNLIDELCFEHHVDVKPMNRYWGRPSNTQIHDTYRIFTELRQLGVRMHSWP